MVKHYCGECENYIPIPGTARGRCKKKQYIKTKNGHGTKEFLPVRMRPVCSTDFVLSKDGLKPVLITCKCCGKVIEKTARAKQEFCSEECRIKWFQEEGKRKRREEHGIKFKCQMCGSPLEGNQKKYCLDCAGKLHKPAEKKAEKKPRKKHKVLSISEINALALAEHLSYGEYVMKYGV